MKIKLFTTAFLFSVIVNAQTSIPAGNVSGTWNLAGSPYLIQGNIQIQNNATLTIDPGVIVNFQTSSTLKFLVLGRLLAVGNATDSIIFTANNTSTGWSGIRFDKTTNNNDTSKILFCKIQYGNANGGGNYNSGGGIYFNKFSKTIVSHCRIINCQATAHGGAIKCDSTSNPIISYNTISNNSDFWNTYGAIFCNMSNPTIIYNNISNNTGGGIYCSNSSNPVLSYNLISFNTNNGGISCINSSPTISYNTISNNSAPSAGGINCTSSNPFISNNTITNNYATNDGGGIYFSNSNSNLINNTIANNKAGRGGALFCVGSNPILRNCILYGNTATMSGGGAQLFMADDSSDPDFYYCDVQGGTTSFKFLQAFYIYTGTYSNNINISPGFVAPTSGSGTGFNGVTADWSLNVTSACIDKGDATYSPYPNIDKAGNPRIIKCIIDIGAYEYQSMTTSLSISSVSCFGGNNGTATVTVNGGTSPYYYSWSNGQTTSTATGLISGNYTVTVNDANSCSTFATFNIIQPSAITISIIHTNATCFGGNNGSATAIASGGTSPYTYNWNSGQTTSSVSGLLAGNYSVTVTDSIGCIVSNLATITQPAILTTTFSIVNETVCGNNDGSITSSVTGGTAPYTYLWSNGGTTSLISGLASGNYSLSVTDSKGCAFTATATVSCPNGITEYNFTSINISPNPSNGLFTIQSIYGQLIKGEIEIANLLGEKIYSSQINSTKSEIDLNKQPQGIYFIRINSEEGTLTKKIIIQ